MVKISYIIERDGIDEVTDADLLLAQVFQVITQFSQDLTSTVRDPAYHQRRAADMEIGRKEVSTHDTASLHVACRKGHHEVCPVKDGDKVCICPCHKIQL